MIRMRNLIQNELREQWILSTLIWWIVWKRVYASVLCFNLSFECEKRETRNHKSKMKMASILIIMGIVLAYYVVHVVVCVCLNVIYIGSCSKVPSTLLSDMVSVHFWNKYEFRHQKRMHLGLFFKYKLEMRTVNRGRTKIVGTESNSTKCLLRA